MQQRKEGEYLERVWALEGSIMTKFLSRWEGWLLAKNFKFILGGLRKKHAVQRGL
jgi:hypothetical protein